jgi:hypothetical protein
MCEVNLLNMFHLHELALSRVSTRSLRGRCRWLARQEIPCDLCTLAAVCRGPRVTQDGMMRGVVHVVRTYVGRLRRFVQLSSCARHIALAFDEAAWDRSKGLDRDFQLLRDTRSMISWAEIGWPMGLKVVKHR